VSLKSLSTESGPAQFLALDLLWRVRRVIYKLHTLDEMVDIIDQVSGASDSY
jgi:hypothetical protein